MSVTTDAHMCEQVNTFRNLVHQIDQDLTTSEINDVKFLVKDFIPQARLEECKRVIDIVRELESRGEVSEGDTALLAELMSRIGRNDLVKKLGYGVVGFKKQLVQSGSRLHPFRVMLHEICDDLVKREVQELLFVAKDHLPASKLEGIKDTQGLFVALEKAELLSVGDVSILLEFMNTLNRKDLSDNICRYSGLPIPSRVPALHQMPAPFNGSGDLSALPPEEYYKMDARPRGICLIINNHEFPRLDSRDTRQGARQFKNRRGSHIDAESLRRTFTRLHMEVVTLENLRKEELQNAMARYAQVENHSGYDCFVCAILTHGTQGHVYGIDGWPVPIKELTNHFKPMICPSLKGKPKLFFIQACQGTDKDTALRVEADGELGESAPLDGAAEDRTPRPDIDVDANTYQQIHTLPNEADFLLGYSTVPGFVSFRDIDEGSWYISSLTKTLDKYATKEDLLSLLTRVNLEVSKEIFENHVDKRLHKQIPAPQFTLRKKVIFY